MNRRGIGFPSETRTVVAQARRWGRNRYTTVTSRSCITDWHHQSVFGPYGNSIFAAGPPDFFVQESEKFAVPLSARCAVFSVLLEVSWGWLIEGIDFRMLWKVSSHPSHSSWPIIGCASRRFKSTPTVQKPSRPVRFDAIFALLLELNSGK